MKFENLQTDPTPYERWFLDQCALAELLNSDPNPITFPDITDATYQQLLAVEDEFGGYIDISLDTLLGQMRQKKGIRLYIKRNTNGTGQVFVVPAGVTDIDQSGSYLLLKNLRVADADPRLRQLIWMDGEGGQTLGYDQSFGDSDRWSDKNTQEWQELPIQEELQQKRQEIIDVFGVVEMSHLALVPLLQKLKKQLLKELDEKGVSDEDGELRELCTRNEIPEYDAEIISLIETMVSAIEDVQTIRDLYIDYVKPQKSIEGNELPFESEGRWITYSGEFITIANSARQPEKPAPFLRDYPCTYNVYNGVLLAVDKNGVAKVTPYSADVVAALQALGYENKKLTVPSLITHERGAVTTFNDREVQAEWDKLVQKFS